MATGAAVDFDLRGCAGRDRRALRRERARAGPAETRRRRARGDAAAASLGLAATRNAAAPRRRCAGSSTPRAPPIAARPKPPPPRRRPTASSPRWPAIFRNSRRRRARCSPAISTTLRTLTADWPADIVDVALARLERREQGRPIGVNYRLIEARRRRRREGDDDGMGKHPGILQHRGSARQSMSASMGGGGALVRHRRHGHRRHRHRAHHQLFHRHQSRDAARRRASPHRQRRRWQQVDDAPHSADASPPRGRSTTGRPA